MSECTKRQLKMSMYQLLDLFYDEIIKYSKDEKTKQMFHKLIKTNLSCSENKEFFEFNREDFSELNGHIRGIPYDEKNRKVERIPGKKEFILGYALQTLAFLHDDEPHAYNYYADQAFSCAVEEFGHEVVSNICMSDWEKLYLRTGKYLLDCHSEIYENFELIIRSDDLVDDVIRELDAHIAACDCEYDEPARSAVHLKAFILTKRRQATVKNMEKWAEQKNSSPIYPWSK